MNTPVFKGMHMLCYFKNLRAFMQVSGIAGEYIMRNVPPNEQVVLIAFGKKEDEFYFGRQEFITANKKPASVMLKKIPEADFDKEIKSL